MTAVYVSGLLDIMGGDLEQRRALWLANGPGTNSNQDAMGLLCVVARRQQLHV
jgi:hypothetical protein